MVSKKNTSPRSRSRREPVREAYDTILIVCEGTKSEPNYLKKLCNDLKLSSTNIHILPATYSDPMNVVKFAEDHQASYDRTYCVFDRDEHSNYDKAINKIDNSKGKIRAITSWPCFEIWVLLHFIVS